MSLNPTRGGHWNPEKLEFLLCRRWPSHHRMASSRGRCSAEPRTVAGPRSSSAVAHISSEARGVDSSLLLNLRRRQPFEGRKKEESDKESIVQNR